tara:strand:+ start:910 stop:1860 length:951 start_codon:yes stop_codon:yes gene_type:complete
MKVLILTISSALCSYIFLKYNLSFLRNYFLDEPNERSSHKNPKPRGGGLVFLIFGGIFSLMMGNIIPLLSAPIAIIGIFDDLFGLTSRLRYFAQLIIVSYLFFLFKSNYFDYQNFSILIIFIILFTIISGTAIINFINFMDGIDGLVGGSLIVILIAASFLSDNTILPLVGSIFGFLALNWYPSKVFMGDSGSTFLGTVFVAILFRFDNTLNTIVLLLIASPLLIDAASCVIRRLLFGYNIFKAHKMHLYQRLNQSGLSHSLVSLIYISCSTVLSFTYLFFGLKFLIISCFLVFILGIYLDSSIAVPFLPIKKNKL